MDKFREQMTMPLSVRIDRKQFDLLYGHLFPGDEDEHGAILAAGLCKTARGIRLLVRDVFLARDGIDYVPGTRGYRALTAAFVAEKSHYCAQQGLVYLSIHCHPGATRSVGFSSDDYGSHERGYPALLDASNGNPVGALVFGQESVAGDIWISHSSRVEVNSTVIVGLNSSTLYPKPPIRSRFVNEIYDRSMLLYGEAGQQILHALKVGVIGAGGGGSLINEWISRLGVGGIVIVDADQIEKTNLPRVVGSRKIDALTFLTSSRVRSLRTLGRRLSRTKVSIAKRVAKQANGKIRYRTLVADVVDEEIALQLRDCDFLFLCTDTMQSRIVFNALIHQYLIPGVQIGAKVPRGEDGTIGDVFAATRIVLPYSGGGCLFCANAISPLRAQEEALQEHRDSMQRYVDDPNVHEPSVIGLNVLSGAQAVNDLMLMFTNLFNPEVEIYHQYEFVQERKRQLVELRSDPNCLYCGRSMQSMRGRGDGKRLPCRPSTRMKKT